MIKLVINGILIIFIIGLVFGLVSAFSSDRISGVCSNNLLDCLQRCLTHPSFEKFLSACQCVWHDIVCVVKQILSYVKGF